MYHRQRIRYPSETIDLLVDLFENPQVDNCQLRERTMGEFSSYIPKNADSIPNYGDKWRNRERISSGFTELAINQVLSRRLVKKQQMRWTKRCAHLLLQTRTQTLNSDLRKCFQPGHPDMKHSAQPPLCHGLSEGWVWQARHAMILPIGIER